MLPESSFVLFKQIWIEAGISSPCSIDFARPSPIWRLVVLLCISLLISLSNLSEKSSRFLSSANSSIFHSDPSCFFQKTLAAFKYCSSEKASSYSSFPIKNTWLFISKPSRVSFSGVNILFLDSLLYHCPPRKSLFSCYRSRILLEILRHHTPHHLIV